MPAKAELPAKSPAELPEGDRMITRMPDPGADIKRS